MNSRQPQIVIRNIAARNGTRRNMTPIVPVPLLGVSGLGQRAGAEDDSGALRGAAAAAAASWLDGRPRRGRAELPLLLPRPRRSV